MSAKIQSRFMPSVVKAAQIVEAMQALSTVPFDSPLRKKSHDAFMNLVEDYKRVVAGIRHALPQAGYEVQHCLDDMKAERKRLAVMRREAREAREAERQMALEMVAA